MVAENCTTNPLHKAQNLMTYLLSAPAHPPLYFLTSPLQTFFFYLGLDVSGLGLNIFHKMSPRTHSLKTSRIFKLENLLRWSFFTFIYNRSSKMNYFIYFTSDLEILAAIKLTWVFHERRWSNSEELSIIYFFKYIVFIIICLVIGNVFYLGLKIVSFVFLTLIDNLLAFNCGAGR